MKLLVLLLFTTLSSAHAKFVADGCPPDQVRQVTSLGQPYCAPMMVLFPQQQPVDCIYCQRPYERQAQTQPWSMPQGFPWMYSSPVPWWAQQGQLFYPNFNYPGIWQYPGIQSRHYPGDGGLFAAKPNVYVKNAPRKLTPFKMKFDVSHGATFLATTPWLVANSWEGFLTSDAYQVEDVSYDYLFYDARLNHRLMQYRAGWCAARKNLVAGMLRELTELGFSEPALKDFDEHWTQKIPAEPVYCVYPQFNQQLEAALPIALSPPAPFTRVVFILVPHRFLDGREVAKGFPLPPQLDHRSLRPIKPPEKSLHYLEWGVAFLDHRLIQ